MLRVTQAASAPGKPGLSWSGSDFRKEKRKNLQLVWPVLNLTNVVNLNYFFKGFIFK